MSVIRILQYPDPRLKTTAKRVEDFHCPTFQKIVDDMSDTYFAAENCAALAATQLDIIDPPHVTVIGTTEHDAGILHLVNAVIVKRDGQHTEEEGCMSVGCDIGAHVYEKVTRAAVVSVEAFDRHGKAIHFEAEGFMAKCVQHELDHLDGKIFLDRLSRLKRQRVEEKLAKAKRQLKKRNSG